MTYDRIQIENLSQHGPEDSSRLVRKGLGWGIDGQLLWFSL